MKKAAVYVGSLQILPKVYIAEKMWERMRGFMMSPLPDEPCGLFIPNCCAIHTFFMRFPIDIYFLKENFEVTKIVHHLSPYKVTIGGMYVSSVLEIPSGIISSTVLRVGDVLRFLSC